MKEEIVGNLEEEIKNELEIVSTLKPGCEQHKIAMESLDKLYRLRLDEVKAELDRMEKRKESERDEKFRRDQAKLDRESFWLKAALETGIALLTLFCYGRWFTKGMKFEETGTISSDTFRRFLNLLKPGRK